MTSPDGTGEILTFDASDKNEQIFDGDGRAVVEKEGHRTYHINNVPTATLNAEVTGYQMWSSVLGASLTKLAPDGTKLETSVFAGGALIAMQKRYTEGGTNYDSIDWTTADPVTGTVGKFSYSSEGSATNTENFEPLGQRLHPHDPEDYEPPVNESFVGSADDAEWQCKASAQFWGGENGNFSDLPWHCQKRMLQDIATPLKDTFGWGGKEESAANVSILIRRNIPRGPHDNGPDSGWTLAANSSRAAALKSTAKDDDNFCVNGKCPDELNVHADYSITDEIDAQYDASNAGDRVRPRGPSVTADPSPLPDNKPSGTQCAGVRELLRREEEHGTWRAAAMSSIEFGGKTKLRSLQNEVTGILWIDDSTPLDQDWLITLVALQGALAGKIPPLGKSAVDYGVGKTIHTLSKKARGKKTENPIPYLEEGERNAVYYAEAGRSFAEIFTKAWLDKNCPLWRKAH